MLKKICSCIGCNELVDIGVRYCAKHSQATVRETASKRGYNYAWQQARKKYLLDNPLCVHCEKNNRLTPATVVDHIKPHRGDAKLFWDKNNWQSLCASCHSVKTAKEDGGFGNNIHKGRGC